MARRSLGREPPTEKGIWLLMPAPISPARIRRRGPDAVRTVVAKGEWWETEKADGTTRDSHHRLTAGSGRQ